MGRFQSCRGMVERALRRAFLDSVLEMYDYEGQDSADIITAVTLKGMLTLTINNVEHFTVRLSEVAQRAEDAASEDSVSASFHQKHPDRNSTAVNKRKRKYGSDEESNGKKKQMFGEEIGRKSEENYTKEVKTELKISNTMEQTSSLMPYLLSSDSNNQRAVKEENDDSNTIKESCQKSISTLKRSDLEITLETSVYDILQQTASQKPLSEGENDEAYNVDTDAISSMLNANNEQHVMPSNMKSTVLQQLLVGQDSHTDSFSKPTEAPTEPGMWLDCSNEKAAENDDREEQSKIDSHELESEANFLLKESKITLLENPDTFVSNTSVAPLTEISSISKEHLLTHKEDKFVSPSTKVNLDILHTAGQDSSEIKQDAPCALVAEDLTNKPSPSNIINSETEKAFKIKEEPIEYDDLPVDFTLPSSKRKQELEEEENKFFSGRPQPQQSVLPPVFVKEEPKYETIFIEDDDDEDEVDRGCTFKSSPSHSLWYKTPDASNASHTSSKVKDHKPQLEQSSQIFELSHSTSHGVQRYDCPLCGEVFHTLAFFTSHLHSHRQTFKRSCSICRISTLTPDALILHLKSTHRSQVLNLPTHGLSTVTQESSALTQTLVPAALSYSLGSVSAIASLVSAAAASQASLETSQIGSGLVEQFMMTYSGFIPCPICQLLCPSKPHLILHLRATHTDLLAGLLGGGGCENHGEGEDEQQPGVEVAKEEKDAGSGADEASTSSSTSSTAFSCFDCSISFGSQATYTQHCLMLHGATSAVSQGTCSVCRRAFDTWKRLQAHYLSAHGVTSFCERCKLGFATTAELRAHHDATHGSETRGQTFTCDICSKAFYSQSQCSAHKRSHVSEKSFACQVCGSAFFKRGDLSKHFRTVHAPNRVFNCRFCGKKGTRMDNMRSHVKSHGKHMSRDEILTYIEEVKSV